MGWLRRIFDTYLFGSLHVALVVSGLLLVTMLEYGLTTDSPYLFLFVFGATLFSYNIIKYGLFLSRRPPGRRISYRAIRLLTITGLILATYGFVYLSARLWPVLIFTGLLSYLYAFPLRGKKSLRALGGLKIIIVAVVWTLVTVWLPWLQEHRYLDLVILPSLVQRFLAVVVLTIPFEIRDMDLDDSSLGTLPQRLGPGGAKYFGTLLGAIYIAVELLRDIPNPCDRLWSIAFMLVALGALWGTNKDRSVYYATFWVEAIPFLWLVLLLLGRLYLDSSC